MRQKTNPSLVVYLGLALILAASTCSAGQKGELSKGVEMQMDASDQPFETPLKGQTAPPAGTPQNPMDETQQVLAAREDLAKQLTVSVQEVVMVETRNVTWRSGALGCPKPGVQYTLALVSGKLIMLRIGTQYYRYHAKIGGAAFHCSGDMAERPHPRSSEI